MKIEELYDIHTIVRDTEIALQIDGKDYAEKSIDVIMEGIYTRMIRQYQLDFHNMLATDQALEIGKSQSAAVLFLENLAVLHAKLCGYLQIVRYTKLALIRPSNFNYMGLKRESFISVMMACTNSNSVTSMQDAINAFGRKFGSINTCLEKKLILIMIVSYKLGLYELVAAIAEIFYVGDKL